MDHLRPNDLRILDNGRPGARVTSFQANTKLPFRLALLIDESDSVKERFRFEQKAAIAFLRQVLRPGDLGNRGGFQPASEFR